MINHIEIKQLISAAFDEQATQEEKNLIEEHLKECDSCRDYSRQISKLSATLDNWDNEDLSPDLEQKLQRGLEEVKMSREKRMLRQRPLFRMGVGGGGVLVAVLILVLSMQTYSQRALQGQLRSATDDIENQFSVGNTNTVYYEPYYLETSSDVAPNTLQRNGAFKTKETASRVREAEGYQRSTHAPALQRMQYGMKGQASPSQVSQATVIKNLSDKSTRKVYTTLATGDADQYESKDLVSGLHNDHLDRPIGINEEKREEMGYMRELYYPYTQPKSNTEEYAQTYESPFLAAQYNPLSTFSIDVDTTSYSNVRRFLNQNQLPPVDAVRIEEMINYFQYDYPQPGWNKPFSITTQASICPWNPQNYLVQIGIKGKVMLQKNIPPSNLVFLIDVSGSMNQANKLPLLKRAFKMFADQLSGNERVAIVTYSGSAGLVLDSTPGSEKWRIHQAIDNLKAGGGTAGAAGIHMAYDIAKRNFIRNGNNRVILATDGDFNVGVSSDSELVRLIEGKRQNGIFLSILGFGSGNYKDAKMEQIADHGNGNYFYIDSIEEGRKVLVDELGSTLFTIAKDVKLQVEFNPAHVKAYKLIGYENRVMANQDFNNDAKDAGELGSGHTVTAFYEIVPAMLPVAYESGVDPLKYRSKPTNWFINGDLMTVKLRYKEPNGNTSKLMQQVLHQRDITNNPSADFQFASAVAEFGLLLRNSPYRGRSSYNSVLMRANQSHTIDKSGRKAEFISLVEKARSLDHRPVYTAPDEYPYQYSPVKSNINFKSE